jgi:hypothetical protein
MPGYRADVSCHGDTESGQRDYGVWGREYQERGINGQVSDRRTYRRAYQSVAQGESIHTAVSALSVTAYIHPCAQIALELYTTPNLPNLPVYGTDFRYSGQWLTTEKDSVEYRLGKTARTFAPEESSPPVRPRPNSASSVPSSPNVNIGSLKPLTPRVKPGPLTPTSSSTGLPSPYMGTNSDFPAQMARQPQPTQGFSGAGTPYGVPSSPSWENRAELNGPGPIRRRRTSSNASVSSRNSGGLALGLKGAIMSPPAPPTVIRSISGEIAQSSENSRWYVELAETATW